MTNKLPEGWKEKHSGHWWRGVNDLPCVIQWSPRRYFAYEIGWRIGSAGRPPFDKPFRSALAAMQALNEKYPLEVPDGE